MGTQTALTSASAASALAVTGTNSTTSVTSSVNAGGYTVTATVTGTGSIAPPTGDISLIDTTNANYVLGSAKLTAGTPASSFSSSQFALSGQTFSSIAAADFNRDGIADLAILLKSAQVVTYLGVGDGTFLKTSILAAPANLVDALSAGALSVADFNEDGISDLAASYGTTPTLQILLGTGDGSFTYANPPTMGRSSTDGLSIGDYNGDGHADLLQVGRDASLNHAIFMALGNGDGTFAVSQIVRSNDLIGYPVSGDFNRDGLTDFAVTDFGHFSIYLSRGDGTFSGPAMVATDLSPEAGMAVGDFNGDGIIDLVNGYGGVNFGNGNGTFNVSYTGLHAASSTSALAVGDYNGDGNSDVAVLSGQTFISFGYGDGTFVPYSSIQVAPVTGTAIAEMDFNGDGLIDIALANNGRSGTTSNATIILEAASATATAKFTALSVAGSGPHQIQARYPGDASHSASESNTVALTAQPFPTTLTISGNPSAAVYGQQVVLTATLNPASLQGHATDSQSITFLNGTTTIGTGILRSGVATFDITSLPGGVNSLSATYTGDTNFAATSSSKLSYGVLTTPTLTLSANPTSSTYGQSVTLTASLNPATAQGVNTDGESITFYSGPVSLGTAKLSGGIATLTTPNLSAGQLSLTVKYSGNTGFSSATSSPKAFTVSKATPSITWAPPSRAVYTGNGVGVAFLNAALVGDSARIAGSISYRQMFVGTTAAALLPSSILPARSYTLTALFTPADLANYTTATVSVPYVVTPAPLTVLASDVSRAYGTANPVLTGTVTGALGGDTFVVTGSTAATTSSNVGTYPITYSVAGTNVGNYQILAATGTLTITQAVPTIHWPNPAPITYGTALGATQLNATSSVPGAFSYGVAGGTVLNAGSQILTANFTPSDLTNYKTQTANASLIVTKAPLAISAGNGVRVFGAANPAFTGSVTGLVNADIVSETFSTTATTLSAVGTYPIVPAVAGSAVANYDVTATNGALTISQAGTATTLALSAANTTFTANVASLTSGSPTGTVAFYVGQSRVGSGAVLNGVATYSGVTLPSGNVTLSAQYSGDANFTQSASPAALVLAVAPASASLTVTKTGSVTNTLTLATPVGYTGSVQFSCTGLPAATTCSFSPSAVSFTGSGTTANVVLTVSTGVTTAKAVVPAIFTKTGLVEAATLLCLPGFLLAGISRRRGDSIRSISGGLALLLLLVSCCTAISGCASGAGSSSITPPTTPTTATPTGSTTFQVVATGSAGLTQSTAITLNVQ